MWRYILLLIGCALCICSCSEEGFIIHPPISTFFNGPIPKRAKNLTFILGKEFTLVSPYSDNDSTSFVVDFDRKTRRSTIVEKRQTDTVFSGLVHKHKDLYFFGQKVADTTWLYHASYIDNDFVIGLAESHQQHRLIDEFFRKLVNDSTLSGDPLRELITFDGLGRISVAPDKKSLFAMLSDTVAHFPKHKLVGQKFDVFDLSQADSTSHTADISSVIEQVYPNPADDILTVRVNTEGAYELRLIDSNGKMVLHQTSTEMQKVINTASIPSGAYTFNVSRLNGEVLDAVKIVVQH